MSSHVCVVCRRLVLPRSSARAREGCTSHILTGWKVGSFGIVLTRRGKTWARLVHQLDKYRWLDGYNQPTEGPKAAAGPPILGPSQETLIAMTGQGRYALSYDAVFARENLLKGRKVPTGVRRKFYLIRC
jgi:hypothetical protein